MKLHELNNDDQKATNGGSILGLPSVNGIGGSGENTGNDNGSSGNDTGSTGSEEGSNGLPILGDLLGNNAPGL